MNKKNNVRRNKKQAQSSTRKNGAKSKPSLKDVGNPAKNPEKLGGRQSNSSRFHTPSAASDARRNFVNYTGTHKPEVKKQFKLDLEEIVEDYKFLGEPIELAQANNTGEGADVRLFDDYLNMVAAVARRITFRAEQVRETSLTIQHGPQSIPMPPIYIFEEEAA